MHFTDPTLYPFDPLHSYPHSELFSFLYPQTAFHFDKWSTPGAQCEILHTGETVPHLWPISVTLHCM